MSNEKSAPKGKKTAAETETDNAQANTTETGPVIQSVKAIKNNLFKTVPVGGKILVAGNARSMETKSGTYGDFTKFIGDVAVKIPAHTTKKEITKEDGTTEMKDVPVPEQIIRAGAAFFPAVAENLIASPLQQLMSEREKNPAAPKPSVEFAFTLVKKPDAESNTGFVWSVETKHAPQIEDDRVLALLG